MGSRRKQPCQVVPLSAGTGHHRHFKTGTTLNRRDGDLRLQAVAGQRATRDEAIGIGITWIEVALSQTQVMDQRPEVQLPVGAEHAIFVLQPQQFRRLKP